MQSPPLSYPTVSQLGLVGVAAHLVDDGCDRAPDENQSGVSGRESQCPGDGCRRPPRLSWWSRATAMDAARLRATAQRCLPSRSRAHTSQLDVHGNGANPLS